ncbi:N-acetylglucosaminyl-diphospho-decaprenol L-rhamnosyltransferase [bacterium HR33]|nr:N-acetylglucosaminyl-diphospho-decaprenol L-rhamnosyltransferase [bacterium HR33]
MRVAAITLNFGAPDDTLVCVESLLGCSYRDLLVLVVDNGSPPEDLDRLRRALPAGVELLETGRNLGFSGGNNVGIRRALCAGADFVLLINNDAWVERDTVGVLLEAACREPRVGIVSGKILEASDTGPTRRVWYAGGSWVPWKASAYHRGMGEPDRGQYDTPGDTEFAPGCLWLVPARVLSEVGLLDEEFFLYTEDLDFCLRVRRAGYRVYYEPRARCYHKISRSHWTDRSAASPTLNYYSNRNRFFIARRWLRPWERLVFYPYLFGSRAVLALLRRDPSYVSGLWDGLLGRSGPRFGDSVPRSLASSHSGSPL